MAELRGLMGKTDERSEMRRMEIARWVGEHRTPEVEKMWNDFVQDGLDGISVAVADLRAQLADGYGLIPMSYVADRYFGKSPSWLAQRINGYEVRGKVYSLTAEQKAIFNEAMQDLSRFFGSIHIS